MERFTQSSLGLFLFDQGVDTLARQIKGFRPGHSGQFLVPPLLLCSVWPVINTL